MAVHPRFKVNMQEINAEPTLSQQNALESLNLSSLKTKFMEWMKQKSNLYPSRHEKLQIAKELGTSIDQINRLLANHRRRHLKNQSKKLCSPQQANSFFLASPTFSDKENQQFPFASTPSQDQQRDKRIEQTIDDIICKEQVGSTDHLQPSLYSHPSAVGQQQRESTPTHHQVVPDLARNMLMTPPESSSYFQPQQYNNNQPTDALHQCEANLMINNNSTLQQGGDQYNNLAALIGTLAQHQQQQQQLLAPALNYFPLHNAPLASQLPDTNLSLPTFLAKQQEAANQQAMQIAIQKELQILYQRHYLQQVMQQQQQLVQQHNNASLLSPLSQHELQTTNYVSGCSPAQSLDQSMDQQFSSSGSSCSSSTAESTSSVNTSVQLPHSRMLTEKESLAVMVLAAGFSPENFSTY